ncbi:MAG: XdhC family protein [Bacteroidetes bacterium]|nr:XdhC family protein [Bacteroidota bacterium]
MKDLLPEITSWLSVRKPFAMARVIQTWGSSPRPVGSALIINADGAMAGSVSGGCVEGHVVKEAKGVIGGKTGKKLSYGVTDDEAWSVGLTCGGKVQVYLQYFDGDEAAMKQMLVALKENRSGVMVTALKDGATENSFLTTDGKWYGASLPADVATRAGEALTRRTHETMESGGVQYFLQVFPRRSQMLIIGAAHITADLVQLAQWHDFETIVIDPRGAFADKTHFTVEPDRIHVNYPSEVLNDYPLDNFTYAVILSHDPKIDDNALQILLKKPLAYIGALGSRKTHEKRIDRLRGAGFSEAEIGKVEAPIGIDINAQGAREIALAIMGSVVKKKNEYN